MPTSPLSLPHLPVLLLLVVALLLLVPSCVAWSSGSGTCDADSSAVLARTSRHPMAPSMQFYLQLPLNYQPGAVYNVSIMNTGRLSPISYFNGFLLYAEDVNGTRHGRFTNPPSGVTVNMGAAAEAERDRDSGQWTCYGRPAATATHSDGGIKEPNFMMEWTAPSVDVGLLTWRGLVESSGVLFYTQVLQRQYMCAPGATCPAFNTSGLPLGPLPAPPNSDYLPAGLFPADRTACAEVREGFADVPFAAIPPGFCASVYAFDLNRPRGIYVTSWGDLLVAETGDPSGVALLRDLDGNGVIERDRGEYVRIFEQRGLNHGLYVHDGYIYTSSPTTMWRVPFDAREPARQLSAANATVVVKNMPEPRNHGTRTPLVSHDGRWLYVSYGSAGNLDDDDRRARVVRYDLRRPIPAGGYQWDDYDNSDGAVQAFAKGLRNEVGLTLDLQAEVWGVMNADDNLNRPDLGGYNIHNDNPSERLDHLREDAIDGFYGYPFCWAVDILPNHTRGEIFAWGGDGKDFYLDGTHDDQWCKQYTLPPTYAMQAHTAPLGVVFYDGKGKYAFPPEFYQQIIVAQHGSWNSDRPRGYKLTRIETDYRGQPIQDTAVDFFAYEGPGAISGNWPHKPVDVRIGVNGELFFSSDTSGTVLVLRYINPVQVPVLVSQPAVAGARLDSAGGPTKAWADFSFDRDGGRSTAVSFTWDNGTYPHLGLALFDGAVGSYVNLSSYNSGAGAAMPQVNGGASSYEMWLWPEAVQPNYFTTLLELAANSSGEMDDVISLSLRGRQGSSSSSFVVRVQSSTAPGVDIELRDAVPSQTWSHVVVAFGYRDISVFINGEQVHSEATRSAPRRMLRSSALLGRSLQVDAPNRPFRGAVDVLRVYSYPLSPAQVALNFLSSHRELISPALYGHFAMQPMESSEATFEHRGAGNRRPPPAGPAQPPPNPDDSVFPGWAHFSGPGSYVDLRNPNSGLGGVWPFELGSTFSVELWFRLDAPDSDSPHTLLAVDELLALSVQSGVLTFNVSAGEREQRQVLSVRLPQTFRFQRWHQVVWSCEVTPGGGQSHHAFWVNNRVVLSADTPLVGAAAYSSRFAVLAPALMGDVAALRVYRQLLPPSVINATYAAQWWGHEQPAQPSSASSSSSSAAPAPSTVVTSSPAVQPTASPTVAPTSAAPTQAPAPTSVPGGPTVPTAVPVSLSSSTAEPATPTSTPQADLSSSSGEGGSAEEGMSMASVIAIVLIIAILVVAAIVGVVFFLRRRRASSGGDERLNRLIPNDSADSYSRL